MVTALKKLGFDKVFDTNTAADLTIMEEANEFIERFTKNDKLRLLEICDEENKRKYLNDDEIKEAVETMYKVRREINNENFPAKRQYLCRFCTYRHICKGY